MGRTILAVLVIATVAVCGFDSVSSDASDHRYKEGDQVPLYANKVGPFHNPRFVVILLDFELKFLFILLDLVFWSLDLMKFDGSVFHFIGDMKNRDNVGLFFVALWSLEADLVYVPGISE